MDSFKFVCPACGQPLEAESDMVGSSVECPACQITITIPQPDSTEAVPSINTEVTVAQPPPNEEAEPTAEDDEAAKSDHVPSSESLTFKSALPLAIYTLGFGWVSTWFLPNRFFISMPLVPVLLLAIPSLILAYVTVLRFLRPHPVPLRRIVLTCAFTMTLGLVFLLFFQSVADHALHSGRWNYGRATGYWLVLKFIGWAYNAVQEGNFFTRIVGYIFGVGLCEEFTKLLPLFFYVFRESKLAEEKRLGYRQFLLVGFFSGLGFGIGEALSMYAPWSGEISTDSNILRWFACVPSHAIYTVLDAAFLWYLKPTIQNEKNDHMKLVWCALATVVAAVVHGIYNSFAALPMLGLIFDALAIALMCWVVVLVPRLMNQTIEAHREPGRLSSFAPLRYLQGLACGLYSLKKAYLITGGILIVALFFSSSEERFLERARSTAGSSYGDSTLDSAAINVEWYAYGLVLGQLMRDSGTSIDLRAFLQKSGELRNMSDADYESCAAGYADGYNRTYERYPER